MLSKEKAEKINLNGLYRHDPVASWRGKLYENDLYWCCNWTFRPVERNGVWYMRDTYWSGGNCVSVELTDGNFDGFEFVFDFGDVMDLGNHGNVIEEYDSKDWFLVPIDSGGINFKHYFLRKDAKPSFERKRERLMEELGTANQRLKYLEKQLFMLCNDHAKNPTKYSD